MVPAIIVRFSIVARCGQMLNVAVLENYVVAEIMKTYLNCGKEPYFYYYRDKDAREMDIVFEHDGVLNPIEMLDENIIKSDTTVDMRGEFMKKVFILYEEREISQYCRIKGVWNSKKAAITQMQRLISTNCLYSEHSIINLEDGCAESDPMYNEEHYSNYYVKEFEVCK